MFRAIAILLCFGLVAACGSMALQPASQPDESVMEDVVPDEYLQALDGGTPLPLEDQIFERLPSGPDSFAAVCSRGLTDAVSRALCNTPQSQLTSLAELQAAVGLRFSSSPDAGNGDFGNPSFALTGHSTSLVMRHVNVLNPRAILTTVRRLNGANPNLVMMGFARGEQFVELVGRDGSGELNFFLVRFKQACNANGCTPADLLTPAVESNWTSVSLYQDEDLKNTVMDCKYCHQPDGPSTPKMLRMQELADPWTHWFRQGRPESSRLILRFQDAHPQTEAYAGIPGKLIPLSDPSRIEGIVRDEGYAKQPNLFPSLVINRALDDKPNEKPQVWLNIFANVLNGTRIPVPYAPFDVTNEAERKAAAAQYRRVVTGADPLSAMPDLRTLMTDDAERDLTVRTQPGATGAQALVTACQRCHNSNLDQTLTRARFNVQRLSEMSREEKDKAIGRLRAAKTSRFRMPPLRFEELSEAEVDLLVQELQK